MGSVIGHGRYARTTYPETGPGGGAVAAGVPLSRQRFIDGDTAQAGLNGSAAEPFKTIAQFMASRADVSVQDANANYVGWVMPALAGYVENISFPPYVSTELRGDSLSNVTPTGTAITGTVTWDNVNPSGGFAADAAVVTLHNLFVSGLFTVTDNGNSPLSLVFFGGDETGRESARLDGGFLSSGTEKLGEAIFYNALIGADINAGTGAANAIVVLFNSVVHGSIIAKSFASFDSTIDAAAVTVSANSSAEFHNTDFQSSTVLTSVGGDNTFDGPSWQSFVENAGTRAAGTAVLVAGGYNGGAVEGAALTGASTDVSLNGTGATAGYTGENSGNHYSTSNGTPTTVTLKTGGGEKPGDTILITKEDLGANVLAVKNNAAATIATIPTLSRGFVLARFDGSDWVFAEGGSLLA